MDKNRREETESGSAAAFSIREMAWIASHVGQGRIGIIGSSGGNLEVALALAGHRVKVLDARPEIIARSKAHVDALPENVARNVTLVETKGVHEFAVAALKDDGPAFDTVIVGCILDSVSDPKSLLARAGEALAPGGRLIVLAPFGKDGPVERCQIFTLSSLFSMLPPTVRCEDVSIEEGIIRLIALVHTGGVGGPIAAEELAAMLPVVEHAALDSQRRLWAVIAEMEEGREELLQELAGVKQAMRRQRERSKLLYEFAMHRYNTSVQSADKRASAESQNKAVKNPQNGTTKTAIVTADVPAAKNTRDKWAPRLPSRLRSAVRSAISVSFGHVASIVRASRGSAQQVQARKPERKTGYSSDSNPLPAEAVGLGDGGGPHAEAKPGHGNLRKHDPRLHIPHRFFFSHALPFDVEYDIAVICGLYPGRSQVYGGEFIQTRVEAYARAGVKVIVVEVAGRNIVSSFDQVGTVSCLRLNYTTYAAHLPLLERQARAFFVHSPTPKIARDLVQSVGSERCVFWYHGFEVRDYRRLYFNLDRQRREAQRSDLEELRKNRSEVASICFSDPALIKVFVSNHLKRVAEADVGCEALNARIIPNYIDGDHYRYIQKDAHLSRRILLIRAFVANNYANDIAVDAIKILTRHGDFPKLQFTIRGFGSLFEQMTRPILGYPNVDIVEGHLSTNEMQELHASHGIFLVPSRYDTQGVTMSEAMASGLVCITNPVAAIPEFADEDSTVLARPDDPEAVARAILELQSNPERFKALSQNAAARVRLQCGFENTIQKELALLSTLLKVSPP